LRQFRPAHYHFQQVCIIATLGCSQGGIIARAGPQTIIGPAWRPGHMPEGSGFPGCARITYTAAPQQGHRQAYLKSLAQAGDLSQA